MPANQRRQTTQAPVSPTSQATAKYTNKDGSKFITVPKTLALSDSSETSPTMAQTTTKPNGQMPAPPPNASNAAPSVNRKKQKRREKEAKKRAAEQPPNSRANGAKASGKSQFKEHSLDTNYGDNGQFDPAEGEYDSSEEDGDVYSGSYGHEGSSANGHAIPGSDPSGKKSKKKKKSRSQSGSHLYRGTNGLAHNNVPLPLPLSSSDIPRGPGISKEKIWNTSSQEERQRIKDFWLSLGNDERKSLVKVEKDAVLKKMKEQQKHSCSCTVCGRKRTAIEEELEVLYDAYYEELEQYAHHQGDGGPTPIMPPPRRFGAMSGLQPPNRLPPVFNGQQPSRGRIVEQLGDDEDEEGDEEYSEDDADEDDYSEDEPEEIPRTNNATDFFNFGNSLTVQGGILTVADDLLKNDGKKFIEMMEQLAERRMAREEDARAYPNPNYGHPPPMHPPHPHSHPPQAQPQQDDEGYDDEEDEDEEYDSQDYDEEDEEEMDTMTEEQRMEEGRRMFQIFAARMFEQRVLTAYKEKVAKERQQKLLEELEEETLADSQKKAKKARDAQKKKEKLVEKKRLQAEEKARQEAKKSAEEAAIRAAEEKKAEEQRLKTEEKRRKREAQKKSEEEERLRKEAEKQRRLQEQRERQAELERKQREAKEKERKEKEELKQKEREAREAKERDTRERKEKQERDKRDKDARVKADKESKEKQKREESAAQQATAQAAIAATQNSKRPQHPVPIATLQPHPVSVASPHIPVATPAIPKAPTPIKLRTSSQQESNGSVPQTPQSNALSQNTSPHSSTPLQSSPGPIGPPGQNQGPQPMLHHPQATSPIHAALKNPPGIPPNTFAGMQPMGLGFGFQPAPVPMMPPGFGGGRMQHDPMFGHQQMGGQYRPMSGPNGMMHPTFGMPMPGRGFPLQHGPPGFPSQMQNGLGGIGQPIGPQNDGHASQSHSRQQSGSFEKPFEPPSMPQAQPIARPAPIGRPASVVHGHRQGDASGSEIDDLSHRLGSRALLDESEESLDLEENGRRPSALPNVNTRQGFAPMYMDPNPGFPSPLGGFNTWGPPAPNPFGPSSLPHSNHNGWGPPPNSSFGAVGVKPTVKPRPVAVRLMIYQACKDLEGSSPDGYCNLDLIKRHIEHHVMSTGEQPVPDEELLVMCDTEGNETNGGGAFDIRTDGNGQKSIRYESDSPSGRRSLRVPGEIGSPTIGSIARYPSGPPPGL